MKKRLKPSVKRTLLIIGVVAVILAAVGGYIVFDEYSYRFRAVVERSGTIKVYPDETFDTVIERLQKEGFVASAEKIKRVAIKHDKDSVRVGNYALSKGESARTLLTRLAAGRQSPVKVTFNNIRTLEQLAGRVARYTLADSAAFAKHFRAEASASGNKANYIAHFIPNTYEMYWTVTPAEFDSLMMVEYNDFWDSRSRLSKAERLGMTREEVVTLASIVIEETKAENEMTAVAGVYINRLAKKIPLQADPTVKFAVGDFTIRRVLNKHLSYDSPYNTYKNTGLPPGPICSPAIVAIDAVLDYSDDDNRHTWLYFCASPDFSGTHAFASTLSEHNRNAAAYHRALNKRGVK